ncbi:hypothetical protein CHS0354_008519 [Potamilus streckersoni]|uniref:Uncharacterized protein n=1 Tax=Potamilus streckersoni TaxID=2493646 RepID=A0AAE0S7W9_9BIVA|nr:hypothetical protein CHS0354_008519 [Potamilus streckersoni]
MMTTLTLLAPAPTPIQSSNLRTQDDIVSAVSQFIQNESPRFHSQSWDDTALEVGHWLGEQIQKERDGWAQKIRMSMQEIEAHRKETLRIESIIQECNDQMKLIAECCNVSNDTLTQMEKEDTSNALPMYIQCLAEVINMLMEDRLMCMHVMKVDVEGPSISLAQLLKSYLDSLGSSTRRIQHEVKDRMDSLEVVNKQLNLEVQKLRKMQQKKQDEIDRLQAKLQEIKEVTFQKFKEVRDKVREKDFERKEFQKDGPILAPIHGRTSPSSMNSAPTPVLKDEDTVRISEEKLRSLKKSAKKLENSLQDALSQMDSFRKTSKSSKYQLPLLGGGKLLPIGFMSVSDLPSSLRKDVKLLPSALHTWNTKFETNEKNKDEEKGKEPQSKEEIVKIQEKTNKEHRHTSKEKKKAKEALLRNLEKNSVISNSDPTTFRSLIKNLDELKLPQHRSPVKYKGQVTKCLRCNKLFTLNDNHKKACCYHPKGKERIEQYSEHGKLLKVSYVWKCCMLGIDAVGCSTGKHI